MESEFIIRLLQQYEEQDLRRERLRHQSIRQLQTTRVSRKSLMSAVLTRLQDWRHKRIAHLSTWPYTHIRAIKCKVFATHCR